ncbi:uncharacterized protein LOC110224253 [Arabidopsis lyrata subsp. lyrata]|uniref:uncharacterized protein LOC110224253 n=1 Tax=Arabidopsis lyrata subsp. lyrata TaxID=81972 RepID=UPI000A29AC75|nr:uncharacterized protein LOC110224253 [Arabidopsis lyrata subsp. lyrata]|eukprot:XP_020865849.1 uncharacterized protein LOC110224253 [Arabidopsis lyrata subsp. lyrata]
MALTPPTNDKPFSISQIKAYVPITLDMTKLNYDTWRELFETHCSSFGVLGHIDGTSSSTPETEKSWKEHNDLVKMWIYGTITESILETVLKPKCSAHDLWTAIESLFRDNKEARAMQLENELRTTVIGDLSVHEYCKKLKSISDLLANVDSPISERVLVMHILNGLSDKFDSIINVIKHKSPFPGFIETRSMLQSEEDRLSKHVRSVPSSAPPSASSSSPTLLYTSSEPSQNHPSTHGSGNHSYSNNSNYGGNRGNRGNRGRGRGGRGYRGRGGRFYNNNYWQPPYPSWPSPPYASAPPPPFHGYSGYSAPPRHVSMMQPGLLGPTPLRPHYESHTSHLMSPSPPQHTLLPAQITHAFNTMSLQDPTDAQWYMDSGATNHIASSAGSTYSEQTSPM